ncbi:MAG: flavin reductase family protein [Candidatus Eisenbacteria bacterium]|nr:flavin reductase family protein [Candidatus Eisenbacteria bacterium]
MARKRIAPGPFVVPMPTCLIGADVDGKPNFMTAAFVGVVNFKPTVVACGLNPEHHTCRGIEAAGAFSLNVPPSDLVAAADYCGIRSGAKIDKSRALEVFRGELPGVPLAAGCRLSCECKLLQRVPLDVDTVYLAEVLHVYVDEEALSDDQIDWRKVDPLIFTFPDKGYWKLGAFVARAWEIGRQHRPQ